MIQYYLVPLIQETTPIGLSRVPKYIWAMNPLWQGADYGMENLMLVSADTSDVQHAELGGYSDVWVVPSLTDKVGTAGLGILKTKLEGFGLPVQWLLETHSYKDIVRFIMGIFMLAQRYHTRANRNLAQDGVVTALTWSQLPVAVRTGLTNIAADLKLDAAGITASMTLREIMKKLIDQFPKLSLRGIEF